MALANSYWYRTNVNKVVNNSCQCQLPKVIPIVKSLQCAKILTASTWSCIAYAHNRQPSCILAEVSLCSILQYP